LSGQRLDRTLEATCLETVHRDAQLVEHVLEVQAIAADPAQRDAAVRVQVDRIGVRGEEVLPLIERRSPGDDLLAALRLEAGQCRCDLAQAGGAAAGQIIEDNRHADDLRVLRRGLQCFKNVAHASLAPLLAQRLGHQHLAA
jgi:hypothetical protein